MITRLRKSPVPSAQDPGFLFKLATKEMEATNSPDARNAGNVPDGRYRNMRATTCGNNGLAYRMTISASAALGIFPVKSRRSPSKNNSATPYPVTSQCASSYPGSAHANESPTWNHHISVVISLFSARSVASIVTTCASAVPTTNVNRISKQYFKGIPNYTTLTRTAAHQDDRRPSCRRISLRKRRRRRPRPMAENPRTVRTRTPPPRRAPGPSRCPPIPRTAARRTRSG